MRQLPLPPPPSSLKGEHLFKKNDGFLIFAHSFEIWPWYMRLHLTTPIGSLTNNLPPFRLPCALFFYCSGCLVCSANGFVNLVWRCTYCNLQVKSALYGKEWIWVGDKFLSSDRIAFQAPPGSDSFMQSVSTRPVVAWSQ